MTEQSQRWEVAPKIFAVRAKALLLEPFPARTSLSQEMQLAALEVIKHRIAESQHFYYGTFGARVYFGRPRDDWGEALGKVALWWLFNEIQELKGGAVTEQAVYVSGWGWVGDKAVLADPIPYGGSERLHSALLRTQFLPWREYLQSAELHGLTPVPPHMFCIDSGRPINRVDAEED